ncbi:MAG: putative motility protein [Firmicutes bacterium]|nr:putative motility protein [Bacillota bacterium]
MVTGVARTASSLKQWELSLEIGTRLVSKAKETLDAEGEGLLKLLESAQIVESPSHLGTNVDIKV